MASSLSSLKTGRTINNKSVLISRSCLGTNIFQNLAEVIKRTVSLAKLLKDILKSLKFYQRTFTPTRCCDKRIPSNFESGYSNFIYQQLMICVNKLWQGFSKKLLYKRWLISNLTQRSNLSTEVIRSRTRR